MNAEQVVRRARSEHARWLRRWGSIPHLTLADLDGDLLAPNWFNGSDLVSEPPG